MRIPELGLREVLSGWNGAGGLYRALAVVQSDELLERDWDPKDIENRASRVLFEELVPRLKRLPPRVSDWVEALPAQSIRTREVASYPDSVVLWAETAARRWPPNEFVTRPVQRLADSFLFRVMRWTVEQLDRIARATARIDATSLEPVQAQLGALARLAEYEMWQGVEPLRPSPDEIGALEHEGFPWSSLAPLAVALKQLDGVSAFEIASRMIEPSDELRWRLFHLSVLGTVLHALRESGFRPMSKRPLSHAVDTGAAYTFEDSEARTWEIWFEGAGVWGKLGVSDPYRAFSMALGGSPKPLGADILVLRRSSEGLHEAFIVECKFYAEAERALRHGYLQASTYASELASSFPDAKLVSLVVVPDEQLVTPAYTSQGDVVIGALGTTELHRLIKRKFSMVEA